MTSINWPPKEKLKLIGTRIDRLDGPAKSSGAAKYSLDIQASRTCCTARFSARRSPLARSNRSTPRRPKRCQASKQFT